MRWVPQKGHFRGFQASCVHLFEVYFLECLFLAHIPPIFKDFWPKILKCSFCAGLTVHWRYCLDQRNQECKKTESDLNFNCSKGNSWTLNLHSQSQNLVWSGHWETSRVHGQIFLAKIDHGLQHSLKKAGIKYTMT